VAEPPNGSVWFGVEVKATTDKRPLSALPNGKFRLPAQWRIRVRQQVNHYGEVPLPVCLFVVHLQQLRGYFSWLNWPKPAPHTIPVPPFDEPIELAEATSGGLDDMVQHLRWWHGSWIAHASTADRTNQQEWLVRYIVETES